MAGLATRIGPFLIYFASPLLNSYGGVVKAEIGWR
jgi:hypothetical protein